MRKNKPNPNQKIDRNTRAYRRENPHRLQQKSFLQSEKKSLTESTDNGAAISKNIDIMVLNYTKSASLLGCAVFIFFNPYLFGCCAAIYAITRTASIKA